MGVQIGVKGSTGKVEKGAALFWGTRAGEKG